MPLIIEIYTKERALKIDTFINHLKPDLSQEVTSIIMEK